MRFLLELVPCCGSPTPAWRKPPGSPTPPPPPESEDNNNVRSLVPPPLRLQKRVRTVAWSPSLGTISENRAVVVGQRKAVMSVGSKRERTERRTSSVGRARAPDRDGRRRDRDQHEYGRSYLSATMIPAFSPTPFVF